MAAAAFACLLLDFQFDLKICINNARFSEPTPICQIPDAWQY